MEVIAHAIELVEERLRWVVQKTGIRGKEIRNVVWVWNIRGYDTSRCLGALCLRYLHRHCVHVN